MSLMTTVRSAPAAARHVRVLVVVAAAGLFAWTVKAAGVGAVGEGIARLGAGFLIVLLLGGARHLARTIAWRRCMDDPSRLPLGPAFAAWLIGNAFGNITPLGLLISEPSKIVLLGSRIPIRESVSALTIETLCYAGTVLGVLAAGTAALLSSFAVSFVLRLAIAGTLAGAAATFGLAVWIVLGRRPLVSRVVARLADRGVGRGWLDAWPPQIRAIEDTVFTFAGRHPDRIAPVLALEVGYHLAAIGEVWIVVAAITGTPPSLLTAFVLEYVNRAITIVFQFVPMWLGVDEAASALAATVLHLGAAAGVSVALVRKGRVLGWTLAGLALAAAWTRNAADE